jgi:hypothetical protein
VSNKRKQGEGTEPQTVWWQHMADSAEQIAESIDSTGLRDKLNEVFEAAIARAKRIQEGPGGNGYI